MCEQAHSSAKILRITQPIGVISVLFPSFLYTTICELLQQLQGGKLLSCLFNLCLSIQNHNPQKSGVHVTLPAIVFRDAQAQVVLAYLVSLV